MDPKNSQLPKKGIGFFRRWGGLNRPGPEGKPGGDPPQKKTPWGKKGEKGKEDKKKSPPLKRGGEKKNTPPFWGGPKNNPPGEHTPHKTRAGGNRGGQH